MGTLGDDADDMGMPGDGDDFADADALPEGIQKEILTPGDNKNWRNPKKGDEVEVHYVGTLQSNGSKFDSSRDKGTPFKFTLGVGSVIKGWDIGVATMKKGEVAKFTIAPEFGYGDSGAGAEIPGGATLVFEVELLGWMSKDDLFGDGRVIKTTLTEGSGWKKPRDDDEVLISFRSAKEDGSLVEDRGSVEYTVGKTHWQEHLDQVVSKALKDMKKGEKASLKCAGDAAYGPSGAQDVTLELSLDEVYETSDVSLQKDKSVMKKQVKEGDGWDKAKDGSMCTLRVTSVLVEGREVLVEGRPMTVELVCGNGEVCDAMEGAILQMKMGEKAVITCAASQVGSDTKLGLSGIDTGEVRISAEMVDFNKDKDTWNMSEEEKLEFGQSRKEVGAGLFRAKRVALAQERFKKVAELFNYIDNFKDEGNKTKAKELKRVCELNKAACALKFNDYKTAQTSCNAVLKEESENMKALYRLAQAEFGLKDFIGSMQHVKKVLAMDEGNLDARRLLKQAQLAQKEEDKKSKSMFTKMCKGLGTGPIPEPGRDRTFDLAGDAHGDDYDGRDGDARGRAPDAVGSPL